MRGGRDGSSHLLGLPNPMRPILRLQIDLRVVAGIIEDDDVSRGEVDALAARARRDQVNESGGVGGVEGAHVHLTGDPVGCALRESGKGAQVHDVRGLDA